jgi:hypothetical protein
MLLPFWYINEVGLGLNHKSCYWDNMSTEPSRLTDDERKKLTRIPDNIETRDVLENLLFTLSLMGILTDENIHQIVRNR